MTNSRENHGHVMSVRGLDGFGIPHRTTRLNDCTHPETGSGDNPVREGEKGIGSHDAILQRKDGPLACQLYGIDTAHLTGADSERA